MRVRLLLLGVALICVAGCSPSSSNPNDKLSPTVTTFNSERSKSGNLTGMETVTVDSIVSVKAIDQNTRRMTVRNFHDKVETFIVAPEVKRLSEIKVGDKIAVRQSRSIAFEVRPPTQSEISNPRSAEAAAGINIASLPPGVQVDTLRRTLVTVQEIDPSANTVTVRTPEGNNVTVYARYPENLSRINVGDTVAVTYSEALAIAVKPLT